MASILVVHDRTLNLTNTIDMLKMSGHQVHSADDAEVALELLLDTQVDAAVLDCHQLDELGGLVTAFRIIRPDMPVIMISAHCRLACRQLHLADACVQKGDPAALRRAIDNVICASRFGLCRSVA